MDVSWNLQKINNALQMFSKICEININLADNDYQFLFSESQQNLNTYCHAIQKTQVGKTRCDRSDLCLFEKCQASKQPEMHKCHAGLIDVSIPIMWNADILGYFILGQMRDDTDYQVIANNISDLPVNSEKMEQFYNELPVFSNEKIQSIAFLASIISKYVLIENMFRLETDSIHKSAAAFIESNFQNDISITDIIEHTHVSKSTLYKHFETQYGCTPGEYINRVRVEKSIEYLTTTNYSINEISWRVGFSSVSYYSKIFKKIMGKSPLNYKKEVLTD